MPAAMTMSAAGMTETAAATAPAGAIAAALRGARECPRGMNVTTGMVVPPHGTREEREDITVIPVFPVTSPVVVMRNSDDIAKHRGLSVFRRAFVIPGFLKKGI